MEEVGEAERSQFIHTIRWCGDASDEVQEVVGYEDVLPRLASCGSSET